MTLAKVVVLEGCDGGGKSTLANWLHNTHDYAIVKTGPPAPAGNLTVTYLDALHAAIREPGRTVFDRCHLGEAVYGPILRGADRIGVEGLAAIERVIAKHSVRLIICAPPWETLVVGWRGKEDLVKNEATLRTVYERYLEEAERLGIVPYDWTAADAAERLKEVIA